MPTTLSTYLTVSNNMSRWQAITQKTPDVSVATKYFQDNIGNVKSAQDLINNPRLFTYAMKAFGLGDMIYAKGLIKKVLEQGVSGTNNLATTLNNPNVLAFAKAFDFKANGAATTSSATLKTTVVANYVTQALDANMGAQNPGVELALYFQQKAPNVTSVYSVLADKKLLTVVQTALGISPNTSVQPIDTQASLLKGKLNITDFQNPTKLSQFIQRFAANYDVNNALSGGAQSTATPSLAASLLSQTDTGATGVFDANMLLSLQGLRFG